MSHSNAPRLARSAAHSDTPPSWPTAWQAGLLAVWHRLHRVARPLLRALFKRRPPALDVTALSSHMRRDLGLPLDQNPRWRR